MIPIRSPRNLSLGSRLGFLLKDSALYGGAAALSKAFALITFPLMARHFSTAEYGVIDFFIVLAGFFGILVVFGQDFAVARFFYEYEETDQRRRLVSQSLALQLAVSLAAVALLLGLSGPLSAWLIEVDGAAFLLVLVLLQVPFLVLLKFSMNLLKWSFQRGRFLTISLGSTLGNALLLVAAIFVFDTGVAGILWIGLINNAAFGLLGLWFVRHWLILPREFGYLGEMLRYAAPLGVICAVGALMPTLERWVIADLMGLEELGLYAAGARVATLALLFAGAFQTAWGPFYLSIYRETDSIDTYNQVLKGFALAMVVLAFGLGALAHPVIVLLATDRYAAGAVIVLPLTLGLVFQATGWITEIGIGISKRSYLNLYAYAAYVAATVAGVLLLGRAFGLAGVAVGVMAGHAVKSLVASWLAQRAYPLAWQVRPVLAFLGLSMGLSLGVVAGFETLGSRAGSGLSAAAAAAVLGLGTVILFDGRERQNAVRALAHRLRG